MFALKGLGCILLLALIALLWLVERDMRSKSSKSKGVLWIKIAVLIIAACCLFVFSADAIVHGVWLLIGIAMVFITIFSFVKVNTTDVDICKKVLKIVKSLKGAK